MEQTSSGDHLFARRDGIDLNRVAVRARLHITGVSGTGELGIAVRGGGIGGDSAAVCSVIDVGGSDQDLLRVAIADVGGVLGAAIDETTPGELGEIGGVLFQMTVVADSDNVSCSAGGQQVDYPTNFTGTGWVGVRSENVTARVLSLSIYSLGP
jgi:hypothetical protein